MIWEEFGRRAELVVGEAEAEAVSPRARDPEAVGDGSVGTDESLIEVEAVLDASRDGS